MNNLKQIPFLDLVSQHQRLKEEFLCVFKNALSNGRFIGGPEVQAFEEDFAKYCGTKHAIGVGSGTDALRFAIIASGAAQGEAIITVPNTFIATTEAITQAGCMPVFVDMDPLTYNMDPNCLRNYLRNGCSIDPKSGRPVDRRTKARISAVIPVHLYGQMADMDKIEEIASEYNLVIIEDACQAHGARYFSKRDNAWKRAGSVGVAGAFSFYPGKNLGACGEAGAVTTDSDEAAATIRMLRDHGQTQKYHHEMEGYNGRLDSIQAGILRVKLKYLPEWNEARRKKASAYNELLSGMDPSITPYEPSFSKAVYHLYVIRVQERDLLRQFLLENNLDTGLHYPVPLHMQKAYGYLGYKESDFPAAEKASREILSLPLYPELPLNGQQAVAGKIIEFLS